MTIRIDVHPAGENLINTRYTSHTRSACDISIMRISRSPRIETFHADSTGLDRFTAPEKEGLSTTSPPRRLADLRVSTQFLSSSQPLK
jgi:hypothetical protein